MNRRNISALGLLLILCSMLWLQIQPVQSATTLTIQVGLGPLGVSADPATGTVYVVDTGGSLSDLSAIDTLSNTVVATVATGNNSRDVAVDPSRNILFVANAYSDSVSVINATTNTVVHTISIGRTPNCSGPCFGNPERIAVNPSTHYVYAINAGSGNTSVIDGSTYQVVSTIPVGYNPGGAVVDSIRNELFIAATSNSGYPSVFFIDGSNNSIRFTLRLCLHIGNCVGGIAVDPWRHRLYVSTYDPPRVPASLLTVIDTSTEKILENVTVGNHPIGVAVNPVSNFVFVANAVSNTVSVINASDFSVTKTLPVGQDPQGIAVDDSTGVVYVADYSDHSVTVFRGPSTPVPVLTTTTETLTTTQTATTTTSQTRTEISEATSIVTEATTETQTETVLTQAPVNQGYFILAGVSGIVFGSVISYFALARWKSSRGTR